MAGTSDESLMILPSIKGRRPLLEGLLWIVTTYSDKDVDGYHAWRTAVHHAQGPWGFIASVVQGRRGLLFFSVLPFSPSFLSFLLFPFRQSLEWSRILNSPGLCLLSTKMTGVG